MFKATHKIRFGYLALCLCALGIAGCASLQLPRIDPTGNRIFAQGSTTTLATPSPRVANPLTGSRAPAPLLGPGVVPAPATTFGPTVSGPPIATAPVPTTPPLVAAPPVIAPSVTAPPVAGPFAAPPANAPAPTTPFVAVPSAPVVSGPALSVPQIGAPRTQIDPAKANSKPIFPGRSTIPPHTIGILPPQLIAPIGSQVVLQAGVYGEDGSLIPRSPVEWSLTKSSPGRFTGVNQPTKKHAGLLFAKDRGELLNTHQARSQTLTKAITLTHNTPNLDDDVHVEPGQSWVMLSSPFEGVSYVTATSPQIADRGRGSSLATVHWIDAQWVLPQNANHPTGSPQTLITTLTRRSDNAPIVGWQVQYKLAPDAPATFNPDGSNVVEVITDELGQAKIELAQKPDSSGVVQPSSALVGIQIIRPPLPGTGDSRRLILASTTVTRTWSSPTAAPSPFNPPSKIPADTTAPELTPTESSGIQLTMSGPDRGVVGEELVYQIEVANLDTNEAQDVIVTQQLPTGIRQVASQPSATVRDGTATWNLGVIGRDGKRTIEVRYMTSQTGVFNCCASGRTRAGLTASDCTATTILSPTLDVQIKGPKNAEVGSQVRFEVIVTNRGAGAATGVTIVDTFDDGLDHLQGQSPIERELASEILPGGSKTIFLSFQVTKPGELCHTVVIEGQAGVRGTASACVTAVGKAAVEVKVTGPERIQQGATAEFNITVRNTGNVPLTNLLIRNDYDSAIEPQSVTPGYLADGAKIPIDENGRRIDGVVWRVERLDPGKTLSYRVQSKGVAVSQRACNRVSVRSKEYPTVKDEACLAIDPAAN